MNANRSVTRRWFTTGWAGGLLAGWLALGTTSAEAVVHYLTVDGAGNADGSSWVNAASNIQAALALADIDEIRMAGGIYDLTVALSWTAGTNVTVRGGYDAVTGDHDPDNQVTILRQTASGQRVMSLTDLSGCQMEHVTVTGGYTSDYGAGLHALNCGVTLVSCVISNNVLNNAVHSTTPMDGGGLYVNGGSVVILTNRIENNRAWISGGGGRSSRGGGIYLANGSLRIEHSTIVSNTSHARGDQRFHADSAGVGHASGSALTVRNCLIAFNENIHATADDRSRYGAGVVLETGGLIESSTIAGNQTHSEIYLGAGLRVNGGMVTNTVIFGNWRGPRQQDFGGITSRVWYSCAPELSDGVNDNMTDDPLFLNATAGDFRLDRGSPCIDTGYAAAWMAGSVDLDGNPRIQDSRPDRSAAPDRGAYELPPIGDGETLACDFGANGYAGIDALEVVLTAFVGGSNTNGLIYRWDFTDDGMFNATGSDKRVVTNLYGPGTYSIRLEVENDLSDVVTLTKTGYIVVAASVLYVSPGGNGTTGWNWNDAYTNLQTAIDQPGVSEIRIAGGDYDLTEQLHWIDYSGVTIRGGYEGVGSPGDHDPAQWPTVLRQTTSGQRVLRMIDLDDCHLEQVTVTGGYTSDYGAGLYALNSVLTITHGVVSNNQIYSTSIHASRDGGGLYINGGSVTAVSNRFERNTVRTTYYADTQGGGVYLAAGALRLEYSAIVSNISHAHGDTRFHAYSAGVGHASGSALTVRNCLIAFNENKHATADDRSRYGAGVVLETGGLIESSTIAGNQTHSETYQGAGLRVNGGMVTNTIIADNLRDGLANDIGFGDSVTEAGNAFYSCASELTDGVNDNLSADPLFLNATAGDFRLDRGSPCIDTGYAAAWMAGSVDLDGNPRIQDGRPDRSVAPDRGAYELSPIGDGETLACDFGANGYAGIDALEVVLTAFVGGSETNGLIYRWDFTDDGMFNATGSDKRVVTNTYGPGTYSVRLEVENDLSDVVTLTKTGYIVVASSVLYVSPGGNGTTGWNWNDAYTNLQTAIDQPGVSEIRIAGGDYDLTEQLHWISHSGVTIRGGYEGVGSPGDHDLAQWPTVLRQTTSGQRVLRMIDLDDCHLDQVTVTGGYTSDYGAGLYALNSVLTITHGVVSNNQIYSTGQHASRDGGGLYINGGSVTAVSNRFERNTVRTTYHANTRGGGVYLAAGALRLEHSAIVSNISHAHGDTRFHADSAGVGHASGSALTVRNCLIAFNENKHATADDRSRYGAGVVLETGGLIESSTIAGNQTHSETYLGAGLRVNGGMVTNAVVFGNWRGPLQQDFGGVTSRVWHSCAPELSDGVNDNMTDDPLFLNATAGDFRLDRGSPCVDTGYAAAWMAGSVDLDGSPRIQDGRPDRPVAPDRGAYELSPIGDGETLACDFGANVYAGIDALEVVLTAFVGGSNTNGLIYRWDFTDDGIFNATGSDKRVVTNTYGPGTYSVRLEVENDLSEVVTLTKTGYIVVASSVLHVSPGGNGTTGWNWNDAYTNLQTAIDQPGVSEIRIAGGDYDLTEQLHWISHSGVTIRGGYEGVGSPGDHDPAQWPTVLRQTTSGQRVLRMIDLDDCHLEQVTVTGGYTSDYGAGLYALNSVLSITDCIVSSNEIRSTSQHVHRDGGGLYINGGSLTAVSNRVERNTVRTTYHADTQGGGVYLAAGALLLEHSAIVSNISHAHGDTRFHAYSAGVGHASGSALTVRNCLIAFNENKHATADDRSRYGAGVVLETGGLIESSTIAGNVTSSETYQGAGLRVNGGSVTNTSTWGNFRSAEQNDIGFGDSANEADTVFYSCALELTLTTAPNRNLADDPLYIDATAGDFRLQHGSPAIDTGLNQPWMIDAADLLGLPRILMGTVDMGCYETVPPQGTLFMFR